MGFAIRPGLISGEFTELCRKEHRQTITADEQLRLQQVREDLAATILAATADELFDIYRVQ